MDIYIQYTLLILSVVQSNQVYCQSCTRKKNIERRCRNGVHKQGRTVNIQNLHVIHPYIFSQKMKKDRDGGLYVYHHISFLVCAYFWHAIPTSPFILFLYLLLTTLDLTSVYAFILAFESLEYIFCVSCKGID